MSKKKASKAPAADPQIGEAAKMQAQIAGDWLDFSREQFAISNQRQEGIDALTKQVTESQLAAQDQASGWAAEDRARYKSTYQPLEDDYINKAKNWDSAERQDSMAGEARADVQKAADLQRQSSNRQMAAMGVNPNSGRFAGAQRSGETATALASAGAANQARNTVRQQALGMQADAINMGKGLPSQAASSAGLGLTAGNSAVGNTLSGNAAFNNSLGIMNSGFGGASSAYGQSANTLTNQYNSQLSAWNAQQQSSASSSAGLWSGIGSAAGMGLMAFSSKELKEEKQPIEGALDAVKKMPVEQWKYKDGVADGGQHIGPYAEDFQQATGMGDGKTINMIDAMGVGMKATQELDAKVEKLGKGIEVIARKINSQKRTKA